MKKLLYLSAFVASAFFSAHTQAQDQAPPSVDRILHAATEKAVAEKKKVFVVFTASWCYWCKKMDSILRSPDVAPVFLKKYQLEKIVVRETPNNKHLENPGGVELLESAGGADKGIPYWLVLDEKGKIITDSRLRKDGVPDGNTGCPATREEIDYFISVLRSTSDLKEEELSVIANAFKKIRSLSY